MLAAILQRLKSKTYWAALIAGTLGVLEANFQVVTPMLPPQIQPFWPALFALLMLVMREFTTGAVGDK